MRNLLIRLACATIIALGCSYYAIANYTATVGSGTNFGSIIIGGVHFPSFLACDATVANQCAAVSAGGALKVDGSAVTQPASIASGQIVDGGNVALGARADAASCTGTQTLISCLKQLDADVKATGTIQGGAANGATASGNPVQAGCVAQTAEAVVTTGQSAFVICDLARKVITLPYANPELLVSGVTAAMTGTTSTSLLAAPAAGLRNYATHLICTNSHATVGTFVIIQDGSGGTTIYEGYAAAVGGGFSMTLPAALRQPTTATALFVQNVTTGANVICSGSGYKGA
jgi:hypothetical protein